MRCEAHASNITLLVHERFMRLLRTCVTSISYTVCFWMMCPLRTLCPCMPSERACRVASTACTTARALLWRRRHCAASACTWLGTVQAAPWRLPLLSCCTPGRTRRRSLRWCGPLAVSIPNPSPGFSAQQSVPKPDETLALHRWHSVARAETSAKVGYGNLRRQLPLPTCWQDALQVLALVSW